MKRFYRKFIIFFPLILIYLNLNCSLFFPDLLNGQMMNDNDLDGIVLINEVSADHPTEADWIEFYNSGDGGVDLEGFYLTDDPLDITKWVFPPKSFIGARSHLVLTCNPGSGASQISFSLKPGTDQIIITSPDLTLVIDQLGGIAASGTGSYGRTPDGDDTWTVFETPTPGSENL